MSDSLHPTEESLAESRLDRAVRAVIDQDPPVEVRRRALERAEAFSRPESRRWWRGPQLVTLLAVAAAVLIMAIVWQQTFGRTSPLDDVGLNPADAQVDDASPLKDADPSRKIQQDEKHSGEKKSDLDDDHDPAGKRSRDGHPRPRDAEKVEDSPAPSRVKSEKAKTNKRSPLEGNKKTAVTNYRSRVPRFPVTRVVVAQSAPVMLVSGGRERLPMGAWVAHGTGTGALHVWDWSKSPKSEIVPGIEFWSNAHVVLSPDGKQLIWASGQILDFKTGRKSSIDLGGAVYRTSGSTYNRIGVMRFSPDGRRLAYHVTNFVKGRPGLIKSRMVHVVEFPSGKQLCKFSITSSNALRFCFSADGKHLFTVDGSRKLLRRDAASGKVTRELSPKLSSYVMSVATSPDGKWVVTAQRGGKIKFWNAATGARGHQFEISRAHVPSMRFSPDGAHLAIVTWHKVAVFHVASGKVAAELPGAGRQAFWSKDGRELTVLTNTTVSSLPSAKKAEFYEQRKSYDILPSAHIWDWRSKKRLRSITSSPPKE